MAWIESHQSLSRHRKTLRAASLLKVDRHKLIGHLQELWWWALDNLPVTGHLGDLTDEEIAQAAEWDGDPAEFLAALTAVAFVDNTDSGRSLHDWQDYAGGHKWRQETEAQQRREAWEKRQAGLTRDAEGKFRSRPQPASPSDGPSTAHATGGDTDHATVQGTGRTTDGSMGRSTAPSTATVERSIGSPGSLLPPVSPLHSPSSPSLPSDPPPIVPLKGRRNGSAEQVFPPWFLPLTKLPGYKNRNHDRAIEQVRAACGEAGVTPEEVVSAFAGFYQAERIKRGWADPVATLHGRVLGITISQVLKEQRAPPSKEGVLAGKEWHPGVKLIGGEDGEES